MNIPHDVHGATSIYQGIEYGIYECPIEMESQIIKSYPGVITCGEGFNVQPNGQSVLVLHTNLPAGKYRFYLNGEYYCDIDLDQDGRGGVDIEDEVFQIPGELIIEIHYDKPYMLENVNEYSIQIVENN